MDTTVPIEAKSILLTGRHHRSRRVPREYEEWEDLKEETGRQSYGYGAGTGSLELARGSHHVCGRRCCPQRRARHLRDDLELRTDCQVRRQLHGLGWWRLQRHFVVRYLVVRYLVVGHLVVRNQLVRYLVVRYLVERLRMVWYFLVWYVLVWYFVVWYFVVRYVLVGYFLVQ